MHILMMTNTYTPILGGLEKSIQSFAAEYRKRGHQVLIVCPEFKGMPAKETHVLRLPSIQQFNGTDFSINFPVPGLLSKLMENIKPDILHAHHPFLVGDMAMRLAGSYHIPLVFTYHTMFEQYTHYLPVDNEATKRFVNELTIGYANLCDHVIAPSESVMTMLIERGVKVPITVVPTGVDVSLFSRGNGAAVRRKLRIPPKAFVVGHIGRLAPEKNLDFMAEAVAEFLVREKTAHFIFAGKGPSKKSFEAKFAKNKVSKRVHFAGVLKDKALVNAYHAMDIFAFTSQSETQGMVVTEAMAAGVPVIAVDAPGVREVLRDRENGRLLSRENKKSFCEALQWAMHLKGARFQQLKEEALATAEDFSVEICASRALRVYDEVRRKKISSKRKDHQYGAWSNFLGRIRTELEMIGNMGKAAGAAVLDSNTAQ